MEAAVAALYPGAGIDHGPGMDLILDVGHARYDAPSHAEASTPRGPRAPAGVMEILVVLFVVLPLAAWFIAAPLWRGRADAAVSAEESERAELEAVRDAKYGEIRDAELDYRTGKLSEAD